MQAINSGRTRERLVYIDLIRAFSCFCVLTVHFNAAVSGFDGTFVYPNSVIPNFYLGGRLYLGDIGVSLFFMLSGASLMYTYKDLKTFYKKRALNIYPMFWIAYALATIFDFLESKTMGKASLFLLIPSIVGIDGYLCTLGMIGFDFYKIGEWFLGCIVLLYLIFPLLRLGLEKQPVITVVLSLLLYLLLVGKVNNVLFILRIPEMIFGMVVSKYHLEKKPDRLLLLGGCAFILACLFRNHIHPLTFVIASCMLLFALFTWVSRWIAKGTNILVLLGRLTYPIFLVHHWLISRLVRGFSLASMSRRDVIVLFLIYLLLSLAVSQVLLVCNNKVCGVLRGKFTIRK